VSAGAATTSAGSAPLCTVTIASANVSQESISRSSHAPYGLAVSSLRASGPSNQSATVQAASNMAHGSPPSRTFPPPAVARPRSAAATMPRLQVRTSPTPNALRGQESACLRPRRCCTQSARQKVPTYRHVRKGTRTVPSWSLISWRRLTRERAPLGPRPLSSPTHTADRLRVPAHPQTEPPRYGSRS
jgi:hypothetical protein